MGRRVLLTWTRTQRTLAQSSAETERIALVDTANETKAIRQFITEVLGMTPQAKLFLDATAAEAVVPRRRAGKLRHVDPRYLLAQEELEKKEFELQHVSTTECDADLSTKALGRDQLMYL